MPYSFLLLILARVLDDLENGSEVLETPSIDLLSHISYWLGDVIYLILFKPRVLEIEHLLAYYLPVWVYPGNQVSLGVNSFCSNVLVYVLPLSVHIFLFSRSYSKGFSNFEKVNLL